MFYGIEDVFSLKSGLLALMEAQSSYDWEWCFYTNALARFIIRFVDETVRIVTKIPSPSNAYAFSEYSEMNGAGLQLEASAGSPFLGFNTPKFRI